MCVHSTKFNSTVFKQLYSDINKTALALESLNKVKFDVKALSVADISKIADVKDIENVFRELQSISKADYGDFGTLKIQESATAVSSLSGELQASTLYLNSFTDAEIQAVISANGLTDVEIEQALAFAQTGEAIKLYNAEVIKAGLQNTALSSTQQKLILDELGLIDATTGELVVTKQVSKAKLEETLINAGLESSEAAVTAERIISTVTQGTQKASMEAIIALTKKQIAENAKYIASMVAAHPVATALGVALTALGGIIVYNTKKEKEYQETIKESVNTMSSATSEYTSSASKLDELTQKYKDLEEQLSDTNITEEEAYKIKSDLYDIQCDLIDNFGDEAEGIDLVNGKYRDQLGLLQQINKEAAQSYLTKNKEDYDNNISYLADKETFRSKYSSDWNSKNSGFMSDDLKNILEANGLTIDAERWRSELGGAFTKYYVEFADVTREEAYDLALKLGEVLRQAGEDNADLMEDPYYELVQSYLSYVTTELIDESELNSAKENTDYYEKLSAMYSSAFGDLYNSFVDARDDYLEALRTGEGVDEAKINFDKIYGDFQNSSKVKSDEVKNAFEDVRTSIDEELVKLSDWKKSLSGSNELNVIAELKLTDDQLRGINWDDEFTSLAEDAFGQLLTYLGASREDIEQVISLLVKMGVVMGEVKDTASENANQTPVLSISQTVDELNTKLKPAMDSLKSSWQDIFTDDGFALNEIDILSTCDSIKSKLDEIAEFNPDFDYSAFENFVRVLRDSESTVEDVDKAFDSLATSITEAALSGAEDFETMKAALEDLGVVNNEIVAFEALVSNTEALKEAGLDLVEVSKMEADEADNIITAFAEEMVSADNLSQAIAMLTFQKELCNLQQMDTSAEVANLKTLAENAGYTGEIIQWLTELEQIYQDVASGNAMNVNTKLDRAAQLQNLIADAASKIEYKPKVDFNGAKNDAKKAGSSAGKSYKDAFQEELDNLKSVLSGIISHIDKQIDAYGDEKSAAVDALEAEKNARIEVIETQKKQLEEQIKLIDAQIKSKQKIIDGIQDEIDAMKDANEERKRQIDLQKAQYELERMQNQRTILQYSEEKGMHYVTDTNGVRDAKQEVEDAKLEIEIANKEKQIKLIEKEINLLEDRKDAINEQIDLLDAQIDQINDYYDKLISETERYWDSLIEGMENYKSRWEELQEVEDQAKLIAQLKELGITTDDITNMSAEAFEKFKDRYLAALIKVNEGNADVQNSIAELGGSAGSIQPVSDAINNASDSMDNLSGSVSSAGSSVSNTASNLNDAATSAGTLSSNLNDVNSAISEEQTAFSNLKSKIDEVIQAINDKIEAIQEEQRTVGIASSSEMADFLSLKNAILEVKETITELDNTVTDLDTQTLDNITNSFQELYDKIILVSGVLGSGIEGSGEGVTNSISSAIQALNNISLEEGIIAQFNNLKIAIDSVTSAISGGGGGLSGGQGQSGQSASSDSGTGGEGAANSLSSAITKMGATANEVIGEPEAEGDGTVIGEFGSLETAVNDVTEAIGIGGEEGSGSGNGGGQGEEDGTLIGSITTLGETTEETLGESGGEGVIGRFESFRDVIGEANEHVHSISDGLAAIDGQEVECTIKVNIETSGGVGGLGLVNGSMNLNSAEYNAKYGAAHVEGTALASGNWAVQSDEKSALMGELGYEIIVKFLRLYIVIYIENLFNCWETVRVNSATT